MKGVVHRRFGEPRSVLRVADVDEPTVGDGDVLVGVRAVGVSVGDSLIARGLPYVARPAYGLRRPKRPIAGLEFAGVVERVGADVPVRTVGTEVFGWGDGALAERIAVPESQVVAKPPGASFEQVAAVPISGTTALQALRDAGGVREGQHVIVVGASGAVGTCAVQIAKALGAEVTAVCSTRNVDAMRLIGADHVVDYTTTSIEATGQRYDLILDIAGNRRLATLRRALAPTGTLVIVGSTGGRWLMGFGRTIGAMVRSPFVRQRLRNVIARSNTADLWTLAKLVDQRELVPLVERTVPFEAAPSAIASVAGGHARGKTVVTMR